MSQNKSPRCAQCHALGCSAPIGATDPPDIGKAPDFCPMKVNPELLTRAEVEYNRPDTRELARQASIQEFECYEHTPEGIRTRNPRILELIQFSHKMGYKKLGLAFCTGLAEEAKLIVDILEKQGFEVVSVRCKTGAVPKEKIGIRPEEKIGGPSSSEAMCNPIAQAMILNDQKVDLAIMLGLCLGHDTLFMQYCRAPMTVLAVKDRVTGHNPLAAVYLSSSYYSRLKTDIQK
ncbi:MAG: DUF1847 domain-containing protein [Dehalococcoidales bacterium]|nr:DUF1847 domain-containing protein [Dehalococcoidales bacterium]